MIEASTTGILLGTASNEATPDEKNNIPIYVTLSLFFGILLCSVAVFIAWKRKHRKPQPGINELEKNVEEGTAIELLPLNKRISTKASDLKDIIRQLSNSEELDYHAHEIVKNLAKENENVLEYDPEMFTELIKRSSVLIGSKNFLKIVKLMAPLYESVSDKPKIGPLACFTNILHDDNSRKVLSTNGIFNSLLQILVVSEDDITMRSKCLRALVFNSEFASERPNHIVWSERFILALKNLLENEADPLWLPESQRYYVAENKADITAQYQFFYIIKNIVMSRSDIFEHLMDLIPHFLTPNTEDQKETPLHALAEVDWDWFRKQKLQKDFFSRYQEVIAAVTSYDPDFMNTNGYDGKTPVQLFMQNIYLNEKILDNVATIVYHLRTDVNIRLQDEGGHTVLHYLTDTFPFFEHTLSLNGRVRFLQLVDSLKSKDNIEVQDVYGKTALHLLVERFDSKIPEHSVDLFGELLQLLKTEDTINHQDASGHTPLHILARNTFKMSEDMFIQYIDILISDIC